MKYVLLIMLACSLGLHLKASSGAGTPPQDESSDEEGDAKPTSLQNIADLFYEGKLTHQIAKSFFETHTTAIENGIESFSHSVSLRLDEDIAGAYAKEEWTSVTGPTAGAGVTMKKCALSLAEIENLFGMLWLLCEGAKLIHKKSYALTHRLRALALANSEQFRLFLAQALSSTDVLKVQEGSRIVQLYDYFNNFFFDGGQHVNTTYNPYIQEQKALFKKALAALGAEEESSELIKELRSGDLTIKKALAYYASFKAAGGGKHEAEEFIDAYAAEIFKKVDEVKHNQHRVFTDVENGLAALWFLSKLTKFTGNDSLNEKSLNAAAHIIDEPTVKDKLLAVLVHKAERNRDYSESYNLGIRAARVASLFSGDRSTQAIYSSKYDALIEGTDELPLSVYAVDSESNTKNDFLREDDDVFEDADDMVFTETKQTSNPRARSVLKRVVTFGGIFVTLAAIVVASALAYKKYGTQNKVKSRPQQA